MAGVVPAPLVGLSGDGPGNWPPREPPPEEDADEDAEEEGGRAGTAPISGEPEGKAAWLLLLLLLLLIGVVVTEKGGWVGMGGVDG